MKNLRISKFVIVCFAVCCFIVSCTGIMMRKEKSIFPVPGISEAIFEYFDYEGNDDFYNENPLTGNDSFYNPILPGWYSDPSICRIENDYFLVTSTFSYFPGIPIFHSNDLINWKQIGHVLDRSSQLVNMEGQGVSGGIFAPAIEYNPANETFYVITTNVGVGNFFVKTKDPFGSWSDPVMLPEVGGIDPSFFFDDDGKAYIVNNDIAPAEPEYEGHRTIRIREFDTENDRVKGPEKIIVDKGARPEDNPIWIEGPHLYKINGEYYLMAAEGGTAGWHSEVIFRSISPMGEYKSWEGNPILTQRTLNPERPNPVTCAGHADLIQTKDGDWWAFFLACRPINNTFENLGRETFMMPVRWSDDGFPFMTHDDEVVPMIERVSGAERNEETTFGNKKFCENFNIGNLGYEWLSLRGPIDDYYSLNSNPGYLTMKCSPVKSTEKKSPAFLARRMQHHKFDCSTKIYFDPREGEYAGILLFKDEAHQYFLAVGREKENKTVSLIKISDQGETVKACEILNSDSVSLRLKVTSRGALYDFYYSEEKDNWKKIAGNIDASYLSTRIAGGFTGATIGLYAFKKH